jgi:hypothetical protein
VAGKGGSFKMTPAGVLVGGGGGLARIAGRFVASRAGLQGKRTRRRRVPGSACLLCACALGCGKKNFSHFPFAVRIFFAVRIITKTIT